MIGLFDSGSGGLSVLAAVRRRAPTVDVVYFGDIKNAPYGERGAHELAALTMAGARVLVDRGATHIVSACNSVALSVLAGAAGGTEIIEMTRPTARALRARAGENILLTATPATVISHIYSSAIGVTVILDELAIPHLAGAIEFGADEKAIERIVRGAFSRRKGKHYDALILGCTHYPLVRETIERAARETFGNIEIIDPADAVADEVVRRFDTAGTGTTHFLLSKDSAVFRKRASELFPDFSYTIEIV